MSKPSQDRVFDHICAHTGLSILRDLFKIKEQVAYFKGPTWRQTGDADDLACWWSSSNDSNWDLHKGKNSDKMKFRQNDKMKFQS